LDVNARHFISVAITLLTFWHRKSKSLPLIQKNPKSISDDLDVQYRRGISRKFQTATGFDAITS
jgi:hypothetical protein